MSGPMVLDWLPRTLLGGGGLLLLTWLAMRRLTAPAQRQRLGEWAMASALLLALLSIAPAWLIVPLPAGPAATAEPEPGAPVEEPTPPQEFHALAEGPAIAPAPWVPVAVLPPENVVAEPDQPPAPERSREASEQPAVVEPAQRASNAQRWIATALVMYGGGAVVMLGRWLLGYLALWRMLRRTEPVPPAIVELFVSLTMGCHCPRLLLSKRARVPFSCGLLRPTIVLPAALARTADRETLRWVLAHEWTHLRRRDAWASLLFGLGQVLYYPLPWFWRLQSQVRLCQEYIADSAAAALGCPEDYAEFLLSWAAAPAAPAGLPGVSGSRSDLFWRITMLLQSPSPVEPRCPRRWSLLAAGGLLTLAVLAASVGLAVQAAPVPVKKEKPKTDDTKKEEPRKADPSKESDFVEEMIKQLPPGTEPNTIAQLRRTMEQTAATLTPEQRKQMVEMMRRMPQAPALPIAPALAMVPPGMGGWAPRRDARLGARLESPSATLAEQLDLPKGQGLVLREVTKDSAADKAGLKPHDILLELNGKPVPDRLDGLAKLMRDIKADEKVDAVVLRKGKKETIKDLALPEAKAAAPGLGLPFAPPGGFPPAINPPPLPNVPALPAIPGVAAIMAGAGGQGMMMTMFRTKDRFTTRHQEGSLVITLTGKVSDGKAKVAEIHVQDARESNQYESADKVPEPYRDKVKNLIEMTEKGPKIDVKP
jgi:beta-lactamase regulating signal transducer with metallopeptidase domain